VNASGGLTAVDEWTSTYLINDPAKQMDRLAPQESYSFFTDDGYGNVVPSDIKVPQFIPSQGSPRNRTLEPGDSFHIPGTLMDPQTPATDPSFSDLQMSFVDGSGHSVSIDSPQQLIVAINTDQPKPQSMVSARHVRAKGVFGTVKSTSTDGSQSPPTRSFSATIENGSKTFLFQGTTLNDFKHWGTYPMQYSIPSQRRFSNNSNRIFMSPEKTLGLTPHAQLQALTRAIAYGVNSLMVSRQARSAAANQVLSDLRGWTSPCTNPACIDAGTANGHTPRSCSLDDTFSRSELCQAIAQLVTHTIPGANKAMDAMIAIVDAYATNLTANDTPRPPPTDRYDHPLMLGDMVTIHGLTTRAEFNRQSAVITTELKDGRMTAALTDPKTPQLFIRPANMDLCRPHHTGNRKRPRQPNPKEPITVNTDSD
jgi:hypothetical protein